MGRACQSFAKGPKSGSIVNFALHFTLPLVSQLLSQLLPIASGDSQLRAELVFRSTLIATADITIVPNFVDILLEPLIPSYFSIASLN